MSDLSIRSLKSATVSIAKISDHIQAFFKWSAVPVVALIAMGFSYRHDLHPLANTVVRM
jgi:hypothetical protein